MNIANFLTLLRIAMIPLAAYMFYLEAFDLAATIFLVACLTDVLDGVIARKCNMITDLGKILDPLADKGMQLTVLISLAVCDRMPRAAVYMILAKEFLMCLGGCFLYNRNIVIAANWYGKAATVVISLCVTSVLLFYEAMAPALLRTVQWVPVFAALGAFLLYFHVFRKTVREGKLL